MKLLIIGGTRFVGRHIVDAAIARGHAVTLFNRGQTSTAVPVGATLLTGDRNGDLAPLAAGAWDAVIDTCGYLPSEVTRMAQQLRGRVGAYLFISSVSAYASAAEPNDEASPLGHIDDGDTTVVDGRTYGPLKALCEAALLREFGAQALILRPGLVVGPHDPTQRFTYWPVRLGQAQMGETVLAPGTPDAPVQFIDARDLAAFALHGLEHGLRGVFNVVSAPDQLTLGEVLEACAVGADVAVNFRWLALDGPTGLVAQGLRPWVDLPLVVPREADWRSFMRARNDRAVSAGLKTRPLADTVADTLAWHRSLPPSEQVFTLAGLTPQREAEVLGGGAGSPPSRG